MGTQTMALHVVGQAALLGAIIWLIVRWDINKQPTRDARAVERQDRQAKQLQDHQFNTGNRIYNILHSMIVEYNQQYRTHLRINRIKDNGSIYSIFVGIEDNSSMTNGGPGYLGKSLLEIHIDASRDEAMLAIMPYPTPDACITYALTDDGIHGLSVRAQKFVGGIAIRRSVR